jgi:hypothetical protein
MIKDTSDVVCCCVDRGTFFPVAERLARVFKKVYFHRPNGEGFETVDGETMGFNYPAVELIRDFWPIKDEIDLFVFPDCRDWALQAELESQGYPVWGSKRAEDLETMRGLWLETAKDIGLPMPHTETVLGLDALRHYLYVHREEKKHIKISRYRGDMETWCAKDWLVTRNKLDALAYKWRARQNLITFYVQDDLDTDIEGGADTYFVGDFPDELILGYEKKGQGYFGAVTKRSEMAPEIWHPSELLVPVLRRFGYCNFFSTEVRLVDGESYLLDPCCRCPSPAGEEQLEMLSNFPDIVWHGANGVLVQPEWEARYCGGLVIGWAGEREAALLKVPEELRRWVKLYGCAYIDDAFVFPSTQDPEALGFVVGIGDTPEEVLDHLKEIREALSDQPVELQVEPIADLITQIGQAKELDIEFGDGDKMPEPAAVIDNGT